MCRISFSRTALPFLLCQILLHTEILSSCSLSEIVNERIFNRHSFLYNYFLSVFTQTFVILQENSLATIKSSNICLFQDWTQNFLKVNIFYKYTILKILNHVSKWNSRHHFQFSLDKTFLNFGR